MAQRSKKSPTRKKRLSPDCQFSDCIYFGETDVYGLCPRHNRKAHEEIGIDLHVYREKGRAQ